MGPDGYSIDLNLAPEVNEFEGFINYGSPIQTSSSDALGNPVTLVLTENRIPQPVFSTQGSGRYHGFGWPDSCHGWPHPRRRSGC